MKCGIREEACRAPEPPPRPSALRSDPASARPLVQQPVGLLLADRASFDALIQEILEGLPDQRPRGDAQALHDLVPVQGRAKLLEVLLFAESGDRKSTRLNSSHVQIAY